MQNVSRNNACRVETTKTVVARRGPAPSVSPSLGNRPEAAYIPGPPRSCMRKYSMQFRDATDKSGNRQRRVGQGIMSKPTEPSLPNRAEATGIASPAGGISLFAASRSPAGAVVPCP